MDATRRLSAGSRHTVHPELTTGLMEGERCTVILTAQPRLFIAQRSGWHQVSSSPNPAAVRALYAPRDSCMWPHRFTPLWVMTSGDLPTLLPAQRGYSSGIKSAVVCATYTVGVWCLHSSASSIISEDKGVKHENKQTGAFPVQPHS